MPKAAVLGLLRSGGYGITRLDAPNPYPFSMKQFTVATQVDHAPIVEFLPHARAKDGQDLFAAALNDLRPGYFVDIGAFDGITGSNSHLLEKQLGWRGLLVEPNPDCHPSLKAHRSGPLETRAVDVVGDSVVELVLDGQKSRLTSSDGQVQRLTSSDSRVRPTVSVRTATAREIFRDNLVPDHINYVSIDIEGLEAPILKSLPFDSHLIDFISVEHNYHAERQSEIRSFLFGRGYVVVHEGLSRNEDWFIRGELSDHPAVRGRR